MSNISSELVSYHQCQSTLSLINNLVASSHLEKDNIIINQLIIKLSEEMSRIRDKTQGTRVTPKSDKGTVAAFFNQEKKIIKYLKLTKTLEETKDKFNTSNYKHYLIKLHNDYKKTKESIIKMEKETPCIKNNAQIYHSIQSYKLKALKKINNSNKK